MKKHYTLLLRCVLPVLIITSASCDKNFEEINTNPNGVQNALPQAFLAPAITSTVSANMSRSQRITNELMQITVNMGDTEGRIFRYDVRKAEADYLWNSWYIELTNFKDMTDQASKEASKSAGYQGIGLICQSWLHSLITDTYGDSPYSESNKAKENNFTPKFDRQKDIYLDIFAKLEQANTLLKTATNVVGVSDPIYAGNVANWRKFGNSLYLRLLLRVSGKAEVAAQVQAKIKEMIDTKPGDYPVMTANTESAVLRWTGVAPFVSPFATWRPADWYTPKLASFFVDKLNAWGDPRVAKWATLADGEYAGIPSGYPVGQAPQSRSTLPTSLQVESLLGNIMNYSELQYILAEAHIKGYITTGSAKTYYENGLNNGITFWGYPVPSGYASRQSLAWNDALNLDGKMELIHSQKYYSLFFTDLESWFEYRRTGHPVLPNNGGLINNGVMPARLNYPVYIQTSNANSYRDAVAAQGADEITTQVWWQKP
ncbi:MAG: SusD/RagB family nutrient-binding outer membrane lipoprotein [Mucilaginibacter polytrichastri]|nr:SusD/RagB family nutrient-binding outer membrane lipoprotein [Mucilaginibacter polytrichastri]